MSRNAYLIFVFISALLLGACSQDKQDLGAEKSAESVSVADLKKQVLIRKKYQRSSTANRSLFMR